MSKKKKRRGAQQKKQPAPVQASAAEEPGDPAEDDDARSERRAQQIRDWEKRKKERQRGKRSLAPYAWTAGIAGFIGLVVFGGFLALSAGGSEIPDAPESTPDPRVAGLAIDTSLTVEADDDGQNVNPRFIPPTITAEAGQVIEIVMPNVGSVVHNLRIAGVDGEYITDDDWVTDPASVEAGDEGRVVVKIDEPGTYPFKCDFHPTQTGTLILR